MQIPKNLLPQLSSTVNGANWAPVILYLEFKLQETYKALTGATTDKVGELQGKAKLLQELIKLPDTLLNEMKENQ